MSEESGANKPFKNSLFAAATGFSFEDSATLLVPVSLDEPKLPGGGGGDVDDDAISEIDLNSDDTETGTGVVLISEESPAVVVPSSAEPAHQHHPQHINIFSNTSVEQDPFTALLTSSSASASSSGNPQAPALEQSFSFSSLWSSASGKWNSASSTSAAGTGTGVSAPLPPSPTINSSPSPGPGQSSVPVAPIPMTVSPNQSPFQPPSFVQLQSSHPPFVPFVPTSPATNPAPAQPPSIPLITSAPSASANGNFMPSPFPPSLSQPPVNTQLAETDGSSFSAVPATGAPFPPPTGLSPGQSKVNNNFRLGGQRLTYAQYPGLMGAATSNSSGPAPSFPPTGPPVADSNSNATPTIKTENVFTPTNPEVNQYSSAAPTSTYFQSQSTVPTMPPPPSAQTPTYAQSPVTSFPRSASQQSFSKPLTFHWFHKKEVETRPSWRPFSITDSVALEIAFSSGDTNSELIATDGGRYDVDVQKRKRFPIYWEESPSEVRRCSWFYKGPNDSRYVPYEEELAERLEAEFQQASATGVWNRRLEFGGGEAIILYNPNAMSHFCQAAAPDEWGNLPENQLRPRVVKRGIEEFEIDDGESTQIDHLVFLVHGIGAICDFKFRSIVEAVDDFRHLSYQLMHNHFKEAIHSNQAGRIEFMPVSWHKALHGEGGIDQKLKPITLKSIPRLRNFTNDTLLDILFYTSPVYAQTIVDTVGTELNRLFNLFLTRNPTFNGQVALAGHSLGSLILFDLLAHQPAKGDKNDTLASGKASEEETETTNKEESAASKLSSRMVSYTVGSGTGQPFIKYPVLNFEPTVFFALGSPIAMFVTVRGIDRLEESFHFPTLKNSFFNIFHPFDPVAYRIETLIDPNWDMRPVLIPHHKGRKRFHLELKETMQRVGADIKQKFLDSLKTTWNTVYQYATFSKGETFEQEMDRVIQGELVKKSVGTSSNGSGDEIEQDVGPGQLNGGRRIDYVLQEAPLESFNEYLFALSSHVCYWESEDTMLMMMKEIYASMGIIMDPKIPKQLAAGPQLASAPAYTRNNMPMGPTYQPYIYSGPESTPGYYSTPVSAVSTSAPFPNSNQNPSGPPPLFMDTGNTAQHSFPTPVLSMPMPSSPAETAIGKSTIIGARPVISPEALNSLRGMDPTAPIAPTSIGPPPLTGFQRKS